jgi:hypothetical protein
MIPNPELVALIINGLRYATAQGHDLSKMSDVEIGTDIARGIYEFEHMRPDELARAVQDARKLIGRTTVSPADPMQQLQQAIAAANFGTRFTVQPLPQPGQGCRERFVVHHSYANGVTISKTEVAITHGGQIVAIHPKFRMDWDDIEDQREEQSRQRRLRAEGTPPEEISPTTPNRWRELLESIFGADSDYVEYRASRPRRRLV